MPKIITLDTGDCLVNISKQEGFFWETVWNHPENRELRQQRKHPNILKKGDRVCIPDRELKEESVATEQRHRFLLKGCTARFTLTLLDMGQPRANEKYTLLVNGRLQAEGSTNAEGTLNEQIPPDARRGLLLLGENREEITINFGGIDPIEEISGVQTRLQNLGFYDGEIDDELNPETVAAIAEFQHAVELPGQGELNAETRQAMVEAHGS